MRKLKLQMQTSIDGFVAGKSGAMDWMTMDWDEGLKSYITEITEPVDCIILGRVLAQGFIDHWKSAAEGDQLVEGAKKMNETHKKVFTKTLSDHHWQNTELINGDLTAEIKKLKNQEGGDIIAYGGGNFVSSLIKEGLIDEYHLCINPVVLGEGMPIFQDRDARMDLEFVNAHPFACGVVINHYRKK